MDGHFREEEFPFPNPLLLCKFVCQAQNQGGIDELRAIHEQLYSLVTHTRGNLAG